MAWRGFVLAMLAALCHSLIDALRKVGSKRLTTSRLVTLVSLLDAVISLGFVAGQGGLNHWQDLENPTLLAAAAGSAGLRLVSLVLYQGALTMAPISTTVPFLSFTPAMLLLTAFLLLGEVPSGQGVAGVMVVTLGGYLLAFSDANPYGKSASDDGKGHLYTVASNPPVGEMSQDFEPVMVMLPKLQSSGGLPMVASNGALDRAASDKEKEKEKEKEEWPVKLLSSGRVNSLLRSASHPSLISMRHRASFIPTCESRGPVMMLVVAAIWSVTSSCDKLGLLHCPSFMVYMALQRVLAALPCVLWLLLADRQALSLLVDELPLLLGVSVSELATVFFYLASMRYLLVSYAVAAKRSGILLSVVAGWLLFKEDIRQRLPFVCIMLGGMLLILFAPDHRPQLATHAVLPTVGPAS